LSAAIGCSVVVFLFIERQYNADSVPHGGAHDFAHRDADDFRSNL
jgi:hypothetical protein